MCVVERERALIAYAFLSAIALFTKYNKFTFLSKKFHRTRKVSKINTHIQKPRMNELENGAIRSKATARGLLGLNAKFRAQVYFIHMCVCVMLTILASMMLT